MTKLQYIRRELDSRVLAGVSDIHDRTLLSYRLESNRVEDFNTFTLLIGDYVNHHFQEAFESSFPETHAQEMGKEILEGNRKTGGTLLSAYHNAQTGLNGGVRTVLEAIADYFKEEALRRFINGVIDTIVNPDDWNEKVELVTELITVLGIHTLDPDNPARYAADFKQLTEAYLERIRQSEADFNRR